jgi:uncharacterized repeat protein (TIGR02543 family)
MKKRMLSILLLCCMVLTLLPTAAFAAGELPDVKFSVPTTFDKTVDLTKQNKELKIKDSKTYLIKGSADPNWYFQYRIKIDGKNNTPHIFLDGVRLQAPEDGPAIELYGGASACLYFIGRDSELIGAENFAALQKNKTEGYLRVLVQTGTKLTCQGGRYGAGIGGSKVGIKKFSQGHGMNLHFGSLATNIYGGEILAVSGVYGAGIGGGQGGVGEWIYVYSGKLTVRSVSEGAGIGGGQGGPGRFIYIKGGTVNAGSESGGAGIGSGDQDGQNKSEDAHHIEISGGTVEAWSNYAGAGIGGGRGGSGYDISITGGVVRAQGYYGAGIGGGMNGDSGNILIKDTTLTALAFPLYPSSDYTERSASAVGRGSNWVHYMTVIQDQEFAMTREENIKIEASDGKSVRLSATGWQWRPNQGTNKLGWGTTTELLIGCVDLQRLSLPYAYNYGRVISELELRCEESTCSHEFGWAIRDDCHIWACKKCGARDPAAEMSKQNGKHIPGVWRNQEQLCAVCGHVIERDTKAPVMETLTDGESYTVEDTPDGKPGAYTFTVSDPAASGETSSGVKSVTINGEPQDGPTYRLPAPDGGNNDAGAEYTVVATDNAGNETTATVRTYRWHHTVTFDANGGSEPEDLPEEVTTAMPAKKVLHGSEYYLPECEFIAPENQQFKAWQIDGTEYPVNAPVTVTADITVKALWEDAPPAHEHRYGDWRKDGTNHWHECTDADCPNREESIKDKAAHVYTDDADTTCDTCGYERTITPPAHEHSYGNWRKDGTSHWHECTDDDCPNREESINDKAAHVYTDDADTTCDVCGYERTVTPPSHEHSYGDWRKDGTSHWHECTDDDCPNREESINDKAAHVYTDDADTTCDVCGYERTVTPPAHKHRYGDWRKDGTNHWHECTDADCPNREESIKDKTAHVYDNDTDTTCNTCGYERTVTPPAHEHIVTFDGNGGTPSVGSMTTTNQKLPSLPSASRSGSYSFDGWYTEKSGGTKITTDTVFSANTTVYAHWTYTGGGGGGYNPPVTYYTLRFETGGGSDIPSVREAYNTYIDLTKYVPTWRGHTFIGWYTERSLMNKVSGVYLTKDMTVYAGWRVNENPGTGANPFTDVSEKDWFYGDVMFVYENGLMLGTSKTLFSPHGTATRGMMATILWRMEGSPVPKGKNSFTDVEAEKWYADAITWTAENGIFAGYGKDKFGPDDPITREQLAAIFYRYADYKGYDLTVKGNLDKFKDADKITDYAKTAMQWAVGSGLMKGKSGNLLDPQGTATRAEIAAMLHRFIEKYELVQGKAPGGLMGWIDPKRLQIPKTGDSSALGLLGISLCTSLAGCLVLTTWQIRRRREEESLQIIEK